MNERIDVHTYALMTEDKPLKVYKKGILGNVQIHVLDPFDQKPGVAILHGYPGDETTFVKLFSQKEVAFFEARNKWHIENNYLIQVEGELPKASEEPNPNKMSDEEALSLVKGNYKTLESRVSEITSIATLSMLVQLAEEENRPAKTIEFLKSSLSKLQFGDEEEDGDN